MCLRTKVLGLRSSGLMSVPISRLRSEAAFEAIWRAFAMKRRRLRSASGSLSGPHRKTAMRMMTRNSTPPKPPNTLTSLTQANLRQGYSLARANAKAARGGSRRGHGSCARAHPVSAARPPSGSARGGLVGGGRQGHLGARLLAVALVDHGHRGARGELADERDQLGVLGDGLAVEDGQDVAVLQARLRGR